MKEVKCPRLTTRTFCKKDPEDLDTEINGFLQSLELSANPSVQFSTCSTGRGVDSRSLYFAAMVVYEIHPEEHEAVEDCPAIQRARELQHAAIGDVPPQAYAYVRWTVMNVSKKDFKEKAFCALAHYAQAVEGLTCTNPAYMVHGLAKAWFASKGKAIQEAYDVIHSKTSFNFHLFFGGIHSYEGECIFCAFDSFSAIEDIKKMRIQKIGIYPIVYTRIAPQDEKI